VPKNINPFIVSSESESYAFSPSLHLFVYVSVVPPASCWSTPTKFDRRTDNSKKIRFLQSLWSQWL